MRCRSWGVKVIRARLDGSVSATRALHELPVRVIAATRDARVPIHVAGAATLGCSRGCSRLLGTGEDGEGTEHDEDGEEKEADSAGCCLRRHGASESGGFSEE